MTPKREHDYSIDWNPRKPAEQAAKFEAAFLKLWDYSAMTPADAAKAIREGDRPGRCPDHVIDVVNEGRLVGVRLICSRDKQPGCPDAAPHGLLHVSASLHHTSEGEKETVREVHRMLNELMTIDRFSKAIKFVKTGEGVCHWFFDVPEWVIKKAQAGAAS